VSSNEPAGPEVVRRLDEATEMLTSLAELLTAEEDLGLVLQRSVDQLTDAVPGADMASVTVLRGDAGETVAASNERVWHIDQDQYAARNGPCLEAARTGRSVRTGVEGASERWPTFASSARTAGVGSYLSCPLMIEDEFAGSLNLYSEKAHGFAEFDEALLRLYIAGACGAIQNARRYAEARKLAGQLGQALESRAVVNQAVGVLMSQRGMTAEQAFTEMSRQSQNTNVKLREIAAGLLEGLPAQTAGG
jgi:GAF domain-containing protein